MKLKGDKKKGCGTDCLECLICQGQRLCCVCANEYHGCVRWQRGMKRRQRAKRAIFKGSAG